MIPKELFFIHFKSVDDAEKNTFRKETILFNTIKIHPEKKRNYLTQRRSLFLQSK